MMSNRPRAQQAGLTLIELLTAMLLAALIVTAAVRLASAASTSYRIQQNLGALQENARFAFHALSREVAQAGFSPEPWNLAFDVAAIGDGSADAATARGDRVVVQRWSRNNCFENPNPVIAADGQPAWHLRESAFSVNSSGSLALRCRYGPGVASLVTQVNNQALVNDVLSMQLLYAQDSDADGNADRWLRGGGWTDEASLAGVRIGLLLATPEPIGAPHEGALQVLDVSLEPPGDGRLYRAFETVAALEGRLP